MEKITEEINRQLDEQSFLEACIYRYTKQIGLFRMALARNGTTLQGLVSVVTQAQAEMHKGQKLRQKLQTHQSNQNQCSSPKPAPRRPSNKLVDKVLSGLYKKETRLFKKIKQIS